MPSNDVSVVLVHGRRIELVEDRRTSGRRGYCSHSGAAAARPFQDGVTTLECALEHAPGPVLLAGNAYAGAVIAAVRTGCGA